MKKISVLVFVINVFTESVNCQITKGCWLVGGSGNLSSLKAYHKANNKTSNATYINVTPNIGYFFIDKLVSGLKLGYSYQKNSYPRAIDINSYSEYYIGSFIRYYFLKKENMVNIFSDFSYQYLVAKNSNISDKGTMNSFTIQAGPSIFLNDVISIELTVGYSITKSKPANIRTNGLFLGIGFQIYLEKK